MKGFKEFHYLRGSEEYKFRWTRAIKRTVNLTLVKKNFMGVGIRGFR